MTHLTPDQLLGLLETQGLATQTWWHDPVHTVEEAAALRSTVTFPDGLHCKNLFLKDKKGALYLVSVEENTKLDMKALQGLIGSARLSFGKPELLLEKLGVTPGSVTPFAVVNDKAGEVQMVLDERLATAARIFAHPLDNKGTTAISGADLGKFLGGQGHKPVLLALS